MPFDCKICKKTLHSPFKHLSNLNKHLELHDELKEWFKRFRQHTYKPSTDFIVDDAHFRLIKYFVSSNMSLRKFRDPSFLDILDPRINVSSYQKLRKEILPEFVVQLRSYFNEKLSSCLIVSFIVDLWTNKIGQDFIALVAVVTNNEWEREFLVIDICPMEGGHNAENIKTKVENMINAYDFDKSKIQGLKLIFVLQFR
jgi:hypothetical protein